MGFIYLSDDLILANLRCQIGKNILSRFYASVNNFENYEEGIDYVKLNLNSDLVKEYYSNFDSPKTGDAFNLALKTSKKLFGITSVD